MFPLLAIIAYLLLPQNVLAGLYNGWFLHSSCASLQATIRQSYQIILNQAQAVIDLHDMGDQEFAALKKMLLPSDQTSIEDAIQRFHNLIKVFSQEQTDGPRGLFENNVIIACDGKRFKDKNLKNPDNRVTIVHYDGDINVDWPHADSSYTQCFGSGILGVPAVTLQYTKENLSKPDVIQLCPWWLTITFGWKFSTSSGINPDWLINIPPTLAQELKAQDKTEMDLYSTLDRYLLKHLLLTYSTKTGNFRDAGMAENTNVDGWLEAVAAAEKGNKEAENLSWLGVGANLIKGGHSMPSADGKLVRITPTTKRDSIWNEEFAARNNESALDERW